MASRGLSKLYFVTPFFGNTGSEVALYNLLIQIEDVEVCVVSKHKGALSESLPPHIKYFDYSSFRRRNRLLCFLKYFVGKIFRRKISFFDVFLESVIGGQDALFYVNTLFIPEAIDYLCRNRLTFIVHCHELQHMFIHLSTPDIRKVIDNAHYIFASSGIALQNLVTLGRTGNMEYLYPGIQLEKVKTNCPERDIRLELGIPPDAFVVCMSGSITVNKNPEAFLEVGRMLVGRGYKIHMLWIGAASENGYLYFLRQKTNEYGMSETCTWVNQLIGDDYYHHLNLCDCFVLTSFQESFSMVLVEALALGKPVMSFRSGGPEEIINSSEIGLLIERFSAVDMANAIQKLICGEISFNSVLARKRAHQFAFERNFRAWFSKLQLVYFNKEAGLHTSNKV